MGWSLLEHLLRKGQAGAALARPARRAGATLRGWRVQAGRQRQAAGQVAVGWQVGHHTLPAVVGVGVGVEAQLWESGAQQVKQFHGEFRPRAMGEAPASGCLVVEVEPEENRQAEESAWNARQLYAHRQHQPAMAPTGHREFATAGQWVVVHARTEHLQAALARQRVIQSQRYLG